MPARTGCCTPPRFPYTTRSYVTADGSIAWSANYFQDGGGDTNYVRCQAIDNDNGLVYVAGSYCTNLSKNWNIVAFNLSDGSIAWDHDVYVDAGSPSLALSNLYDVTQIQIDPDGNIVCMLDSSGGSNAHFVRLQPDGTFIDHLTFSTVSAYDSQIVAAYGFTINEDGDYHVGGRHPGLKTPYFYDWAAPFSSPPTFYDIEAIGGTKFYLNPYSVTRFGTRDYVGGFSEYRSFFGGGPNGDGTLGDGFFFPAAAIGKAGSAAPHAYADFDFTLPKIRTISADTLSASGTTQAGAATLALDKKTTITTGVGNTAVKLPGSPSLDDFTLSVKGSGATFFPNSGNKFTWNYGNYFPDNQGLDLLSYDHLRFTAIDSTTWHIQNYFFGSAEAQFVPFVDSGGNIYTCGGDAVDGGSGTINPGGNTGRMIKYDSAGVLQWYRDCYKVQAIADSSGNVYGIGPKTLAHTTSISSRDSSGNYRWGHRHAGTGVLTASLMGFDADESHLITSGNNYEFPSFGGAVDPTHDQDFMPEPCPLDECAGHCLYTATNETTVYDHTYYDDRTSEYTTPSRGVIIFEMIGAGGGGGASDDNTAGGGGGGSGARRTIGFPVEAGITFGVYCGVAGAFGVRGAINQDGGDGGDTHIISPLLPGWSQPYFASCAGGKGGKSTDNGSLGGAGGADPGASTAPIDSHTGGSNGSVNSGKNGGNGADFTSGPPSYGHGGVSVGNVAPESGNPQYGGGGGGGYQKHDGANGAAGTLRIRFLQYDWADASNDCETGCSCLSTDDITDAWGRPLGPDHELEVNCVAD